MSQDWTADQILQLAPDAASASNGKKLATTKKWVTLGYNTDVLWGECQGSGSKPYQTRIALDEPAFKCSCPSRKFPCKHALALFLLYAQERNSFTEQTEPPEWVADWWAKRQQRQTTQANKASKPVDEKAQAKRAAKRANAVQAGIDELHLWLQDNVRNGLAALKTQPYSTFSTIAARLVDAQAGGLAAQVHRIADIAHRGDDNWADQLLQEIAQLHLLLQSYNRLAQLPSDLQHDIRNLIGWTQNKDELLQQQPPIQDTWFVLAQYIEQENDLLVQRIWLKGQQQAQSALILNFAHSKQPQNLDYGWLLGKSYQAELLYYPATVPLRALVKQRMDTVEAPFPNGFDAWRSALQQYRSALQQQPWLDRYPLLMQTVYPQQQDGYWHLVDNQQYRVPLHASDALWTLTAVSGGQGISVFGEWHRDGLFHPLGVMGEQSYYGLVA